MGFDHKDFLNFALVNWMKDKKALKYFIFLVFFNIILLIITNFCMYILLEPFSKAGAVNPAQFGYAMVYLFVFVIGVIFIGIIVPTIVVYFIMARGLELINRSFVELSGIRLVKIFVLSLASSIVSFLSLFRIRWLLLLIASVALFFVSLVTLIIAGTMIYSYDLRMIQNGLMTVALFGVFLSFLGFLAYLIVVMYNSLRLSLSSIIFVEKEKKILDCLKESWDLTQGKIINSFGLFVVLIIILIVISSLVSLPLQVYTGQIGSPNLQKTPAEELTQMVDPVVIILTSIAVFFQLIIAMVEIFGLVFIYGQLKGFKGQKKEQVELKSKSIFKSSKTGKKPISKRK